MNEVFKKLSEPFAAQDIEWRAGVTNADKTKALALAYITSRAVMNRLDEAVGPENWMDRYEKGPDGGVLCGISIRIDGEWITKFDGAENSDFEAVKGGLSDAFKRAAVKWGIGRYLYNLEARWVGCEMRGKNVVITTPPQLPAWALPAAEKQATTVEKAPVLSRTAEMIQASIQMTASRENPNAVMTDGKAFAMVGLLEGLFSDNQEANRHALTRYIFGVESTKDLTHAQKIALWRWMEPAQVGDVWTASDKARKEAAIIIDAANK